MSKRPISRILISVSLIGALLTQGCATIVNHRTMDVPISTSPAGAKISINGQQYISPAIVPLERNRRTQTAQVSLEGYQTQEIRFKRSVSGWLFGNFIFSSAFWLGMVVDLVNGRAYNVSPQRVTVNLVPGESSIKSATLAPTSAGPINAKTYDLALHVRFTNESWFPLSKQEMTDAVKDKLLERLSESGRFRFSNDAAASESDERGYLNVDISLIESIETVKLTTTLQIPNGATYVASEDDTIANKDRKAIFETFRNVGKKVAENLTKKMSGKI